MAARGLNDNLEQKKAFKIIAHHVISGGEQLTMYIGGRGGTGKSYLIETIVLLFRLLERTDELRIGAPTGIAASLIGGNTIHSLLGIGQNFRNTTTKRMTNEWTPVRYFIIDKMSMVGAQLLALISSRMRTAKGDAHADSTSIFGGVNMIFLGDFYQLSPPKQPSLFSHRLVKNPSFVQTRNNEGLDAIAGAYLWRQIVNVVVLQQNVRQSEDPIFAKVLDKIRTGETVDDRGRPIMIAGKSTIQHLRERELAHIRNHSRRCLEDFIDAPVIVGSKILRDTLNANLLYAHARRVGADVHTYFSTDTIHTQIPYQSTQNLLWRLPSSITNDAFGILPLFIGMKVMITENVSVPFRVVNGSEGIVDDIKYTTDDQGRRIASVVYVSLRGCQIQVPGLAKGIVPLFPTTSSIQHRVTMGETSAKSFRRRQIPLVPSYAYTDYKSQGRTLTRAIVDLTSARGQGVYVMLSRVTTFAGLLILRWFPESKILQRMSGELRDELKRLDVLRGKTTRLYDQGLLTSTTVEPSHPK